MCALPTDRSIASGPAGSSGYISPKELALRWDCSVSTAHRIAKRAALTRVLLGEGKNGLIRFPLSEVEAYESARSFNR
jgi:hypothetical protein